MPTRREDTSQGEGEHKTITTATLILRLLRHEKMTARALKAQLPDKSLECIRTSLRVMVTQKLVVRLGTNPARYAPTPLGASAPARYLRQASGAPAAAKPVPTAPPRRVHPIAAEGAAVDEDGFPVLTGDAVVAFARGRAPNSVFALGGQQS